MANSVFIDGSSYVTGIQTIIDNLPSAGLLEGKTVNFITDDEGRRVAEQAFLVQQVQMLNDMLASEGATGTRNFIELR